MTWQDELIKQLALGRNMFILWGNTGDMQKNRKGEYATIRQYLVEEYLRQRMVIFYSISTGIQFVNTDMENIFRQEYLSGNQGAAPANAAQRVAQGLHQGMVTSASIDQLVGGKTPEVVLPLLAKVMENSLEVSRLNKDTVKKLNISGSILKKAIIVDFAHNLVPASSVHQSIQDRIIVETLENISRSQEVSATGNVMILITPNLVDLADPLRSTQTNIPAIRIPKPNEEERTKFWSDLIQQNHIKVEEGINAKVLGIDTSGLSIWQIRSIYEDARYGKLPITLSMIKEEKRKILEKEFGDRVKIKIPTRGFKYFGGKKKVKEYLLEIRDNILRGMLRRVPMGILAAGPPGTGKTFLFECWAYECGFNFVEIQNPRNMYVGNSEANMQRMLACLEDLAPVIVVEDEADQSEGSRDALSGDSGVSNRLRQKKFEFCSRPDIRGRVIWVRISNRPDLIDSAYKRKGRSDEIIPFVPPSRDEYPEIFKVKFSHYEIPTEIRDFSIFIEKVAEKKYVTGADIEWMTLESDKIAAREGSDLIKAVHLFRAIDEWENSIDPNEINRQIILSIEGSSRNMRPENWEDILKCAKRELGDAYQISKGSIHPEFRKEIS